MAEAAAPFTYATNEVQCAIEPLSERALRFAGNPTRSLLTRCSSPPARPTVHARGALRRHTLSPTPQRSSLAA